MSSSASKSSVAMIRVRWNYDQEIKVELRVWPKNFEDSAALTAVRFGYFARHLVFALSDYTAITKTA